jgi:bifunctional DNA-binding transcriptional regulator/antitoxin component of YhaV-PrlF toxin-antitoxin module
MQFDIVMIMKTTLTITSKGQTTLPATIRKKLGIPQSGGTLHIAFDEHKGEAVITKPLGIEDLSRQISRHIKPGTKPLLSVDNYYQKHRDKK